MQTLAIPKYTKAFPEDLRHVSPPPHQIYVRGDLPSLLAKPRLAIVGTRRVTAYGRQITKLLAQEAVRYGLVIVSGLALGVDALAHKAALEAGGLTIAVLPSSLHKISPASNTKLAQDIVRRGGVLISEYPDGTQAFKQNFIARNRLVAGISNAILITEASAKSGTMHTVAFALDQGKPVLAVPGNITSPYSEGTNSLIKAGATPVADIADVLHALQLSPASPKQLALTGDNDAETTLLKLLQSGITHTSQLLTKSNLHISVFNQTLTMLEITDRIESLGAGHWGLKR